MSTPIDPRDDGPIEDGLRAHLWRLRARLVTPPEEGRVAADLDRLHRAALEHAHLPTSGREAADPSAVNEPNVVWMRVGPFAAALLLVAAVGGGLAAVGGWLAGGLDPMPEPVSADASAVPAGTVPGAEAPSDADAPGASGPPHDDLEGVGRGSDDNGELGGASAGGRSAVGGDGWAGDPNNSAATDPDAARSESGADREPPTGAGDADEAVAPTDGDADETGAQDPRSPNRPDERPDGQEITAAPDPGEIDGFGGDRPCPGGSADEDCLADRDPGAVDDDRVGLEPAQPESPSQVTTPTG